MTVLYTGKEPGEDLIILALSPVTTSRLLGASLRRATGSDDKTRKLTKKNMNMEKSGEKDEERS